jgi:hypothetical protein
MNVTALEPLREKPSTLRTINIELLALDLTTCTRCMGTLTNIERAIGVVHQVLEATGAAVRVQKIVIESEEQAHQYHFVSSPTVRVNGRDIAFETVESHCDSCTDLCGCAEGTNCRVWRYQGQAYTEAPVGLIVEALLHELYQSEQLVLSAPTPFSEVPANLQRFFHGKAAQETAEGSGCCAPSEQQICCAPSEEAECCTPSSTSCGCMLSYVHSVYLERLDW